MIQAPEAAENKRKEVEQKKRETEVKEGERRS